MVLSARIWCAGPAAALAAWSFTEAQPPAPADPAIQCLRQAQAALVGGRADVALGWFAHASALAPANVLARLGTVLCLLDLDRDEEAVVALEEAYGAAERAGEVPFHMARLLAIGGHSREAVATLGDAIQQDQGIAAEARDDGAFHRLRDHPIFLQTCGEM